MKRFIVGLIFLPIALIIFGISIFVCVTMVVGDIVLEVLLKTK